MQHVLCSAQSQLEWTCSEARIAKACHVMHDIVALLSAAGGQPGLAGLMDLHVLLV